MWSNLRTLWCPHQLVITAVRKESPIMHDGQWLFFPNKSLPQNHQHHIISMFHCAKKSPILRDGHGRLFLLVNLKCLSACQGCVRKERLKQVTTVEHLHLHHHHPHPHHHHPLHHSYVKMSNLWYFSHCLFVCWGSQLTKDNHLQSNVRNPFLPNSLSITRDRDFKRASWRERGENKFGESFWKRKKEGKFWETEGTNFERQKKRKRGRIWGSQQADSGAVRGLRCYATTPPSSASSMSLSLSFVFCLLSFVFCL